MKIALITYAFYESTLPLYKHLAKNCTVDLYCLFSNKFLNPPSFDISDSKLQLENKVQNIEKELIPAEIKTYLGNTLANVNLYISKSCIANVVFPHRGIANKIKNQNYDLIHFINLSANYYPIIKGNYKTSKIICSIHEANLNRALTGTISIKHLFKLVQQKRSLSGIKYFNHITFFSNNEKQKFLLKYPQFNSKSSVIKFGLFETFKLFKNNCKLPVTKNYFLYMGYIRPYKGVDFLLKVIEKNKLLQQYHFIIAGKDDMRLCKNKTLPNVTFINKFLKDHEITNLIKNAHALILPYQNASQSGLPNIAFCFGKPVIYSNVKGLNEYLTNNYNGVSFKVNSSTELIKALLKTDEEKLYLKLKSNILKSAFIEDLSWSAIVKRFQNIYNQLL